MSTRRTLFVHGIKFRMNPHGVTLWDKGDGKLDAFYYWPERGLVPDEDAGKELRGKVADAFDAAGVRPTCSKPYTYCRCPARF